MKKITKKKKYQIATICVVSYCFVLLSIRSVKIPQIEPPPTRNISKQVWTIYLGWWGNPIFDKNWSHWCTYPDPSDYNLHKDPPYDNSLSLAPQLGYYSSHDRTVIRKHLSMMRSAGITGVLFEWWGKAGRDIQEPIFEKGGFSDETFKIMIEEAPSFGVGIGILFQTYESCTPESIYEDFQYIANNYINLPGYLKIDGDPVISIAEPWGSSTNFYFSIQQIRKKHPNLIFIAEISNRFQIGVAMDDGYFAVFPRLVDIPMTKKQLSQPQNNENSQNTKKEDRLENSAIEENDDQNEEDQNEDENTEIGRGGWLENSWNWVKAREISEERGIFFIPVVSPGFYAPGTWSARLKSRGNGQAYGILWKNAIKARTPIILINSFNNWIDGNQIEPAMETVRWEMNEENWLTSKDPEGYLKITHQWVQVYARK